MKLLRFLAALWLAVAPAVALAATHGAPYSAVGWQMMGNASFNETAITVSSLAGLNVQNTGPGGFTGTFTDGPSGFVSFWIKGYVNYTCGSGCGLNGAFVMATTQGGASCVYEDPTGFYLPLDNSVTGTTALRVGWGNSACGVSALGTPTSYGSGGPTTSTPYTNVPLTATSGSGSGATVNLTVVSGAVQAGSITLVNPGTGYQAGDTQTISSALIGGTTGFTVAVSAAAPTNWASAVSNNSALFNVPLTNTTWNHILIAWNFQAGQSGGYATEYVNGVQNANFAFDGVSKLSIPLNVNYTNPGGWYFGGAPGAQTNLSAPAQYADIFVDLTHNIMQSSGGLSCATVQVFVNPGSGPCAVGSGTGVTTPKRINITGGCKDFFGWQPTFCFTNDNPVPGLFPINQGYGGKATLSNWGYGAPRPVNDPVAVQANVLQPILSNNQLPYNAWGGDGNQSSITTSVTLSPNDATARIGTNYNQQCIAPGDLLVASVSFTSASGVTTVNPPTGWATLTTAASGTNLNQRLL